MSWALLIALLVKSGVVAGAGLACSRFLAWRPVERVDVLRATVCLLLALPVITALIPSIDLALLPPLPPIPALPLPVVEAPVAVDPAIHTAWSWPPTGETIGAVWLFGMILVAGRLMLGLRTLTRWTRQGRPVTCPAWLAPIADLPQVDRPKLVSSDRVEGPLSWGVAPGAILVDPDTLADRNAASAIMAHELAHLRRHDWLFLVLSRVALAMFWFNPLVWRLHAVLAERSEEAADAAALRFVDRAVYARTLVRLASHPLPRPSVPHLATAMAADARTLKTRIACIMTDTSDRRRPLTLGLTVAALAAVATPLAALALTRQATPATPAVPATPVAAIASQPAQLAQPAQPTARKSSVRVTEIRKDGHVYTSYREATPEEMAAADEARAHAEAARGIAEEARRAGEEARRVVEAHRGEIEAARRMAEDARRQAFAQRDLAREAGERAREAGELAREAGERAREAGERARVEAARHMVEARVHMAEGAVEMRRGAKEMREEATRLRDPAYRAKQIEENRKRGQTVTDAELKALSESLPKSADALERSADRLAAQSRQAS